MKNYKAWKEVALFVPLARVVRTNVNQTNCNNM